MGSPYRDFQSARDEAARCLYCVDAPCVKGCPTEIDIPQFIRLIRWNDIKGAKKIIKESNCFGGLCGYLCPAEELCEKNCVYAKVRFPIQIAALQRFACDNAEYAFTIDRRISSKKKVAILGAGPSGLSCGIQLRAYGYGVEIFEKHCSIGGIVVREIPTFKIPQSAIDKELDELDFRNIRINFGMEVDREFFESHLVEEYDAAFLAIGLSKAKRVSLMARDLGNVHEASDFLGFVKKGALAGIGGICITIGGGDTAIDCARTALQIGAERSVVAYRRSRKEMPAGEQEYLESVRQGVEFLWMTSPVGLKGKKKVTEVTFIRNELVASESVGRRQPRQLPGTEFSFPADNVVFALGKDPYEELQSILGERYAAINLDTLQIGESKFFAGGDCVNGGKTVVQAVAEGKRAASSIDRYLRSSDPALL